MSNRNVCIVLDQNHWINIELATGLDGKTTGILKSNLKDTPPFVKEALGEDELFDAAIDGMEGMILALACAGVDVTAPIYVEAILTTLDSIINIT